MDSPDCPCLAERPPSVPLRLDEITSRDGAPLIEPRHVNHQVLFSTEDWIYLVQARMEAAVDRRGSDDGGTNDPDYEQGWDEAKKEEYSANPPLGANQDNEDARERVDARRNCLVGNILTLEEGAFAELSYSEALQQYEVNEVVRAYCRGHICLHCTALLERARTDSDTKNYLLQLLALFVKVGEPIPTRLRDWAGEVLLSNLSKKAGRPRIFWNRDQKIEFAIDILVSWTGASLRNACGIVSRICQERRIAQLPASEIKRIWKRQRQRRETKDGTEGMTS